MALLTAGVLVVNAGSTSLKLSVVEGESSRPVHALSGARGVAAVAHRVVHGGDRFVDPVRLDDSVVEELEGLRELAPLHNVPALAAIREARHELPGIPHVAVFDTAFHRTIPAVARTYLLPARYDNAGIHRFGFHGLSVAWVAEQVDVPRLVVCHLGGGCSVTAVRDGHSIDTTMGFTPLEGVPMATRAGSLDPGILLHLLRQGVALDELDEALEHEAGLLGLGGSGDVAELLRSPDPAAKLALEIFAYRVAQAIGAMAVALGGIDAVAFTGGIGEHAHTVRAEICAHVAFLGARVEVVAAREDIVAARAARALLREPDRAP